MHSTASDGGYTPYQLMKKCHDVNLEIIALTDHDTVNGIAEAIEAGNSLGLTVIPGIEFSTKHGGKSVHILGYGIDWKNEKLLTMLAAQREMRRRRLDVMLAKLEQANVPLQAKDVLKHVDGGAIGRPHVAKALIEKGYVSTVAEAFDQYLAEGKPCYVEKEQEMTVEKAISWIHKTGGLAIVAHPVYYNLDSEIVNWVKDGGLDGIEVYHRDHDEQAVAHYETLCKQIEQETGRRLLRTGGSDFHHEDYGRVPEPLGVTRLKNEYAHELLRRLNQ